MHPLYLLSIMSCLTKMTFSCTYFLSIKKKEPEHENF